MMVQCQCGQKYNIKESLYGKVVRCRKCGNNMQVGYPQQQVAIEPLPSQQAPAQPQITHEQPAHQQPTYGQPTYGQPTYEQPTPQQPVYDPPPQPQQPAYDPNAYGGMSDSQMSMGPSPYAPQYPARPAPGKRPRTKQIRYDFSKVNLGLRLIFGGTLASILCMFAVLGFAFAGVPFLALLMILGAVIGAFVSTAGYILCIFVPEETGARGLIIGAVSCAGLNVLCSIADGASKLGADVEPNAALSLLSFILQAGSITLFLLFLKKVAEFVDNPGAAHDAHSLLVFYWIVMGICFGFAILLIVFAIALPPIAVGIIMIVGGIGMLVTWIIWFVHFMAFINDLEFKKRSAGRRKPRRW